MVFLVFFLCPPTGLVDPVWPCSEQAGGLFMKRAQWATRALPPFNGGDLYDHNQVHHAQENGYLGFYRKPLEASI